MDKAMIIRQSVTMQQVVAFYGFKPNKQGFICCPFHNEKEGSLKIYSGDRGFACHACNEHGSVIDFAMKLFNINFSQAIVRLSNDFNLNLTNQKADIRQIKRLKQQAQSREKQNNIKKLIEEWHLLEYKISEKTKETININADITDEQANAIVRSTNAETWLLNNL